MLSTAAIARHLACKPSLKNNSCPTLHFTTSAIHIQMFSQAAKSGNQMECSLDRHTQSVVVASYLGTNCQSVRQLEDNECNVATFVFVFVKMRHKRFPSVAVYFLAPFKRAIHVLTMSQAIRNSRCHSINFDRLQNEANATSALATITSTSTSSGSSCSSSIK